MSEHVINDSFINKLIILKSAIIAYNLITYDNFLAIPELEDLKPTIKILSSNIEQFINDLLEQASLSS